MWGSFQVLANTTTYSTLLPPYSEELTTTKSFVHPKSSIPSLTQFLFTYNRNPPPNSKMSDPVTEIAYLPLKPDLDLTSGDIKEVWQSTLRTIASQPGFKTGYWGKQIENPDTVQLVIGKQIPAPPPFPLQQKLTVCNTQTGTHSPRTKPSCPAPPTPPSYKPLAKNS